VSIRSIAIGTASVFAVVLILSAAWVFDSSSAKESSAEKDGAVFSYPLPGETEAPTGDILISCNEEMLQAPTTEFAKWKGLSGVPLAFPGGPLAIARLDDIAFSDTIKPAQRASIEVLKRYSPRRVVLVAHDMCLYYDTIAAWNDKLPESHQYQADDLQAAMRIAREWFPKAEVSGYNARIENNKLVFHPVAESGR
jgi:hypothetical protein